MLNATIIDSSGGCSVRPHDGSSLRERQACEGRGMWHQLRSGRDVDETVLLVSCQFEHRMMRRAFQRKFVKRDEQI